MTISVVPTAPRLPANTAPVTASEPDPSPSDRSAASGIPTLSGPALFALALGLAVAGDWALWKSL